MNSTMHRIFLLYLFVSMTFAGHGIDLYFTEEPKSVFAKSGSRVRLRCKTNVPVGTVTWYFNDVMFTSQADSSGSLRERKKRNKEDRLPIGPHIVESDMEYATSSFYSQSESKNSGFAQLSNTRKNRRKRERKRRGKRKNKNGDFAYDSVGRYARSVDNAKSTNPKNFGVQIREGRLSISSFSDQNEGSYYCVAATKNGAIRSKQALVKIAYISNLSHDFAKTLTAKTMAVVIGCKLPESLPAAEPKWKINDTWIEDLPGIFTVLSSGSLLIKNVTSLSGSEFRCDAYNSITKEIKMAPQTTTLFTEENGSSASDIIYPTPHENIDAKIQVGKQLLMECVSGDMERLIWTRHNGTFPDSGEITEVGLYLPSVKASDSGRYICRSNKTSKFITYNVIVTENPGVTPKSPSRVTLTDDGDITSLKCETRIIESDWEWFYNGDKVDVATGAELNVSLKSELSKGFYQCFARHSTNSAYAIFQVEENNDFPKISSTTEDYFAAILDAEAIASPKIARSNLPTGSTSHTLKWTTTDSNAKLFSIKYYKEPHFSDDDGVVNYPSKVVNVPGTLQQVVLSDLETSSTYIVEMVAVSSADARSEIEISSFGTATDPNSGTLDDKYLTYKPSLQTQKPKKVENKGGKPEKVPKPPSRPVVNSISPHRVSLTWSTRGNGGSPILGYKIQKKNIQSKDGWETVGKTIELYYEVGNLKRGAAYKYRIIAYNAIGNSQPSDPYKPQTRGKTIKRLEYPPYIKHATTQGDTDIVILWQFERVPVSSIGGYYVFHRPTDSDNEEDYEKEIIKNPAATSHVIKGLQPEMQYDIKIQAFNRLGDSPYSNVYIIEMPKPGARPGTSVLDKGLSDLPGRTTVIPSGTDRNDEARDMAYQRNTIFLITGAVIGVILIILLLTVFCYWRNRSAQNAQNTPELKQKNGAPGGYAKGKRSNHINMTKIHGNGYVTPKGSNDSPQNCHSPHDTRCHCSRQHSNHSSLGRDSDYPRCALPPAVGYPGNWSPGNFPNIHSNPLHMYVDHRHPYFVHGSGRGVPVSSWVRGNNGEFCHVIGGDSRKMSGEGGPEIIGLYPVPGGHMVTRTYAGNVTNGDFDDSTHRTDNGYHSNEDGTRTSSDSQAEKSDDATTHLDDDVNSADAATSGVITLNDVTIESRPSSSIDEEEVSLPQTDTSKSRVERQESVDCVETQNGIEGDRLETLENSDINEVDENTNFLTEEDVTT